MRTFISLNPDFFTRSKISVIQADVKRMIADIDRRILNMIRWEDKDKFHLTLLFIGDVDESKLNEIKDKLLRLESESLIDEIEFNFKNINAFPKLKYPRVLFAEFENKDKKVFQLSEKINIYLKECGIISDKRFYPHITLGRVKRECKINLSSLDHKNNKIKCDLNFSVKNFYFMESKLMSKGSVYSEIREFNL